MAEDEAELGALQSNAGSGVGMERGEAGLRGYIGGSSINTVSLISDKLWGDSTCSTASFSTF